MEDHRIGDDESSVPCARGPPSEVDVVSEEGEARVEPAELVEDVATDEHPRGVHRESVMRPVMLSLVVLAALETCLAATGATDRDAHFEQPAQRRPGAQLGAQDRHRWVLPRGGEEHLERIGCRSAVVMEQPEPLVTRALQMV